MVPISAAKAMTLGPPASRPTKSCAKLLTSRRIATERKRRFIAEAVCKEQIEKTEAEYSFAAKGGGGGVLTPPTVHKSKEKKGKGGKGPKRPRN